MSEKFPIFISWSGQRSKAMALAIRDLVKHSLQATDPWISVDIASGERWNSAIADRLEASFYGIFCINADNFNAPWILFEAGAIAKSKNGRVCVVLEPELGPEIIPPNSPLSPFQARRSNEEDLGTVLDEINEYLGSMKVDVESLVRQKERNIPECLEEMKSRAGGMLPPITMSNEQRLEEIHDMVRRIEGTLRREKEAENSSLGRQLAELEALGYVAKSKVFESASKKRMWSNLFGSEELPHANDNRYPLDEDDDRDKD